MLNYSTLISCSLSLTCSLSPTPLVEILQFHNFTNPIVSLSPFHPLVLHFFFLNIFFIFILLLLLLLFCKVLVYFFLFDGVGKSMDDMLNGSLQNVRQNTENIFHIDSHLLFIISYFYKYIIMYKKL